MTADIDKALQAVHRANMDRYRKILGTTLTENERQFVERRLAEEKEALRTASHAGVAGSGDGFIDASWSRTMCKEGQVRMITLLAEEMIESSDEDAPRQGIHCHHCSGRFSVLVRVEPRTSGPPVTYYACERCAHIMVRKS